MEIIFLDEIINKIICLLIPKQVKFLTLLKDFLVRVLNYPFEPLMVPNEEDRQEYVQCFTNSRLYLIGTAHFSVESQEDVMRAIQQVQPDAVMVELCASRISILSMDEETLLREARLLTFEKMLTIIRHVSFFKVFLFVIIIK